MTAATIAQAIKGTACRRCNSTWLTVEEQPYTHDIDIYCRMCGMRHVDVTDKLPKTGYGTFTIGSPMNYGVHYAGVSVPS